MALPPLTLFEKQMYKDFASFYIIQTSADGNTTGYKLVSTDDGTLLQNLPCNKHSTENFDTVHGGVAMSKEDNIMTANHLTCQYAVGSALLNPALGGGPAVTSGRLVKVVSRYGDTEWWEVQGDVQTPVLMAHTHVYGVPRKAPVIVN